jgi:hypothetical protein
MHNQQWSGRTTAPASWGIPGVVACGLPLTVGVSLEIELKILLLTSLTPPMIGAPRSVLPGPLLDGLQACRWSHLWRAFRFELRCY